MKRKRILLIAVVFLIYYRTNNIPLVSAQSAAPYTITQVQTSKDLSVPESPEATMETRLIAYNSAGSLIKQVVDKKGVHNRSLYLAGGLTQSVVDDVKSVSTIQLSSAEYSAALAKQLDPSTGCSMTVGGRQIDVTPKRYDGDDVIQGVPIKKYKTEFPDGTSLTIGYAPSLRCETLYQEWDTPTSIAYVRTLAITHGEPEPALFQVGSNYVEVPPSVLISERQNFLKLPSPNTTPEAIAAVQREDTFYYSHK